MDSKAVAIVIVGLGIIILIVGAALGSPADDNIGNFSGWPSEARAVSDAPIALAKGRRLSPAENPLRSEDERDFACAVALRYLAQPSVDQGYCVLAIQDRASGGWRCAGKFVHNCIGDFPSDDSLPPDILEIRSRQVIPAS